MVLTRGDVGGRANLYRLLHVDQTDAVAIEDSNKAKASTDDAIQQDKGVCCTNLLHGSDKGDLPHDLRVVLVGRQEYVIIARVFPLDYKAMHDCFLWGQRPPRRKSR